MIFQSSRWEAQASQRLIGLGSQGQECVSVTLPLHGDVVAIIGGEAELHTALLQPLRRPVKVGRFLFQVLTDIMEFLADSSKLLSQGLELASRRGQLVLFDLEAPLPLVLGLCGRTSGGDLPALNDGQLGAEFPHLPRVGGK